MTNNSVSTYYSVKGLSDKTGQYTFWKFATKEDVAEVINSSMSAMGLTRIYDPEVDFYRLVQFADTQTMFAEWEKSITFLSI